MNCGISACLLHSLPKMKTNHRTFLRHALVSPVLTRACAPRARTRPGAADGVSFLFAVDFSKLSGAAVLTAMGLAFFKLSIGMGCMMTYGSYFRDDQHIPLTTVRVMCADLFVSMLAGIAIFPAVFAFGFEPSAGPSLLFITIPAVFASIPFGHLFMVLFFVLSAIAATGAMLSILEVPVSVLSERFHMSRRRATLINLPGQGAGVRIALALAWRRDHPSALVRNLVAVARETWPGRRAKTPAGQSPR